MLREIETPFELAESRTTPYVHLDAASGHFEFVGSSLPENPFELYSPVLEWLESYVERPAPKTVLSLRFRYYNTSTSKVLLMIFEHLERVFRRGLEVEVRWYFHSDDEDMEEAGYEFSAGTALPFTFIPDVRVEV